MTDSRPDDTSELGIRDALRELEALRLRLRAVRLTATFETPRGEVELISDATGFDIQVNGRQVVWGEDL
jgi:hypothetical protein